MTFSLCILQVIFINNSKSGFVRHLIILFATDGGLKLAII